MGNSKRYDDRKVKRYIDNLFTDIGESQQLFDLKEELTTNMKEKITDYKSRGMEEDQAFKEAVVSMGDLSGLVDDMRKVGQDKAKQSVYAAMSNRISTAGIVVGSLLILFGILTTAMLFFMDLPSESVVGSAVFVVPGGALITYSGLTRETQKRYGMNKIRAGLYAISVALLLFAAFVGVISGFATNEVFIAVSSSMLFLLVGVGLFLALIFTGSDRRKK